MTPLPRARPPVQSCDCHVHVFGPYDRFPLSAFRSYTPPPATVDDLAGLHRSLGIDRVVVVQPSVYGTDNTCTLDALSRLGRNARGVAVVSPGAAERELRAMDEAGVRAIRLNFGAVGQQDPSAIGDELRRAAGQVAGQRWHVQAFMPLSAISQLTKIIADLPVPLVLDHFGCPNVAACFPGSCRAGRGGPRFRQALRPLPDLCHGRLVGPRSVCPCPDRM